MSQFISSLKSKMKMVAARASDALAQAADIVAPTLYESRAQEFHHRWLTVSRFLESVVARELEPSEQRRLLLESHTRDSLQKMVLLIYAEENALDRLELSLTGSSSARAVAGLTDADASQDQQPRECLEYLLERQIIPHLCDAGKRDEPSGIMSLAMQFVAALLSRVNYPLLPTREVHASVVALIEAATKREVEDPVVRKCLLNLLNVLWKKLRADPVQTEFFFHHADRIATTADTADDNGSAPPMSPTTTLLQQPSAVSELVLFTALLPHMYAMGKVGDKCREALVIAAAVHEKTLCRFILTLTPFCHYAVNGVIAAFDSLPKTLRLPEAVVSRRTSSNSPTDTGTGTSRLETELHLLAVRLRFCCTLAMVAWFELTTTSSATNDAVATQTSIAHELLLQFRTRFLEGPLLEGLLHTSEAVARTATLYARVVLEEIVASCSDTSANPLLFVYTQFLLQQHHQQQQQVPLSSIGAESDTAVAPDSDQAPADPPSPVELTPAQLLPTELLHRMDSLSSSLSIATIDLFTYLLELEDAAVDAAVLGDLGRDAAPVRRRTSSAVLSPVHANGAIWFATRFPGAAVASNVHLWNIAAFDRDGAALDIPAADDADGEHQVLSLLAYIADAEYAACQRAPAAIADDDSDTSDDDESDEAAGAGATEPQTLSVAVRPAPLRVATTSRTAAARSAMKPLRDVHLTLNLPSFSPVTTACTHSRSLTHAVAGTSVATAHSSHEPSTQSSTSPDNATELPLVLRVVFNRLERLLENSFEENVALSGLVAALALKPQCAAAVFDVSDSRGPGASVRAILEDVHADALRRIARLPDGPQRRAALARELVGSTSSSDAASVSARDWPNANDSETRLLYGAVVLDEILKELCAVLFAKERVRNLPLKPEGYYLEPKRSSVSSLATSRKASTDTNCSDAGGSSDGLVSPTSASGSSDDDGSSSRGSLAGSKQPRSVGNDFEKLLAEAESSIASILESSDRTESAAAASAASVDAVIDAIAATEFR